MAGVNFSVQPAGPPLQDYRVDQAGKLVRKDPISGEDVVYKVTVKSGKNKQKTIVTDLHELQKWADVLNKTPLKDVNLQKGQTLKAKFNADDPTQVSYKLHKYSILGVKLGVDRGSFNLGQNTLGYQALQSMASRGNSAAAQALGQPQALNSQAPGAPLQAPVAGQAVPPPPDDVAPPPPPRDDVAPPPPPANLPPPPPGGPPASPPTLTSHAPGNLQPAGDTHAPPLVASQPPQLQPQAGLAAAPKPPVDQLAPKHGSGVPNLARHPHPGENLWDLSQGADVEVVAVKPPGVQQPQNLKEPSAAPGIGKDHEQKPQGDTVKIDMVDDTANLPFSETQHKLLAGLNLGDDDEPPNVDEESSDTIVHTSSDTSVDKPLAAGISADLSDELRSIDDSYTDNADTADESNVESTAESTEAPEELEQDELNVEEEDFGARLAQAAAAAAAAAAGSAAPVEGDKGETVKTEAAAPNANPEIDQKHPDSGKLDSIISLLKNNDKFTAQREVLTAVKNANDEFLHELNYYKQFPDGMLALSERPAFRDYVNCLQQYRGIHDELMKNIHAEFSDGHGGLTEEGKELVNGLSKFLEETPILVKTKIKLDKDLNQAAKEFRDNFTSLDMVLDVQIQAFNDPRLGGVLADELAVLKNLKAATAQVKSGIVSLIPEDVVQKKGLGFNPQGLPGLLESPDFANFMNLMGEYAALVQNLNNKLKNPAVNEKKLTLENVVNQNLKGIKMPEGTNKSIDSISLKAVQCGPRVPLLLKTMIETCASAQKKGVTTEGLSKNFVDSLEITEAKQKEVNEKVREAEIRQGMSELRSSLEGLQSKNKQLDLVSGKLQLKTRPLGQKNMTVNACEKAVAMILYAHVNKVPVGLDLLNALFENEGFKLYLGNKPVAKKQIDDPKDPTKKIEYDPADPKTGLIAVEMALLEPLLKQKVSTRPSGQAENLAQQQPSPNVAAPGAEGAPASGEPASPAAKSPDPLFHEQDLGEDEKTQG